MTFIRQSTCIPTRLHTFAPVEHSTRFVRSVFDKSGRYRNKSISKYSEGKQQYRRHSLVDIVPLFSLTDCNVPYFMVPLSILGLALPGLWADEVFTLCVPTKPGQVVVVSSDPTALRRGDRSFFWEACFILPRP